MRIKNNCLREMKLLLVSFSRLSFILQHFLHIDRFFHEFHVLHFAVSLWSHRLSVIMKGEIDYWGRRDRGFRDFGNYRIRAFSGKKLRGFQGQNPLPERKGTPNYFWKFIRHPNLSIPHFYMYELSYLQMSICTHAEHL